MTVNPFDHFPECDQHMRGYTTDIQDLVSMILVDGVKSGLSTVLLLRAIVSRCEMTEVLLRSRANLELMKFKRDGSELKDSEQNIIAIRAAVEGMKNVRI